MNEVSVITIPWRSNAFPKCYFIHIVYCIIIMMLYDHISLIFHVWHSPVSYWCHMIIFQSYFTHISCMTSSVIILMLYDHISLILCVWHTPVSYWCHIIIFQSDFTYIFCYHIDAMWSYFMYGILQCHTNVMWSYFSHILVIFCVWHPLLSYWCYMIILQSYSTHILCRRLYT